MSVPFYIISVKKKNLKKLTVSVFKVSLESAHNLYDDLKSKLIKIILYMVPLTSFGYLRVLGSFALTL